MATILCGKLLAASLDPPTMTECGLPLHHDGGCATHKATKRVVSYNPEAVLCPWCTKRIRLNNIGVMRVHVRDKAGSEKCEGSKQSPLTGQVAAGIDAFLNHPGSGAVRTRPAANPFSDAE